MQSEPGHNRKIDNYEDFWPFYLQEHAKPKTRLMHYIGSSLALVCLFKFLTTFSPLWLLLGLLSGYGFAWVSHFFIEHNKPATFTYPKWSFISDWRMFYCFLTGKLDEELKRAGVK